MRLSDEGTCLRERGVHSSIREGRFVRHKVAGGGDVVEWAAPFAAGHHVNESLDQALLVDGLGSEGRCCDPTDLRPANR